MIDSSIWVAPWKVPLRGGVHITRCHLRQNRPNQSKISRKSVENQSEISRKSIGNQSEIPSPVLKGVPRTCARSHPGPRYCDRFAGSARKPADASAPRSVMISRASSHPQQPPHRRFGQLCQVRPAAEWQRCRSRSGHLVTPKFIIFQGKNFHFLVKNLHLYTQQAHRSPPKPADVPRRGLSRRQGHWEPSRPAEFIMFEYTTFLVLNTQFLVLNTQFLVLNTQLLV